MVHKLTLTFIPYADIHRMESSQRIKKILDSILAGRIVIMQGKLEASEEAGLIQATMALVGRIKGFQGVEIAVINPEAEAFFAKVKLGLAKMLAGQSYALTIVGPATVVKEIKKDPRKIELMLKN